MSRPYDVVTWRGFRFNARTVAMMEWAEKQAGVTIQVAQGSFNPGGVQASGSTHAGSAVDIRTSILTERQRKRLLRRLKDAGFAAWYRPTVPGLWGEHIHAIPMGNHLDSAHPGDKQTSSAANWQCQEYLAGRSGLTSRGADRTYRPRPQTRWSWKRGKPVES